MKIGIDARLWNETGVGRYIRALVTNLMQLDKKNDYVLFLGKTEYESLKTPANWQKKLAAIHWHTLSEQLHMPRLFDEARLTILHIPYFSVPIYTKVPYIVTIHDLTISHFATGKATTLPLPLYWLKRMGYHYVLKKSIYDSCCIITVSEAIKQQLMREFAVAADKITVTYEAGALEDAVSSPITTPTEYLLYVGNAHPHKNLQRLIEAFGQVKATYPAMRLVLIGKNDFFYQALKEKTPELENSGILLVDEVSNGQLAQWYRRAKALVFPSLSEGFGIPGLEAMSMGTPVIASDLPVFHEIYAQGAHYFDQRDVSSIAQEIIAVLKNKKLIRELKANAARQVKKYSWKKMAQETLRIYEDCARI